MAAARRQEQVERRKNARAVKKSRCASVPPAGATPSARTGVAQGTHAAIVCRRSTTTCTISTLTQGALIQHACG